MNNERKVTFHDDDEPIKWTEMSGSPEARAETYRNVGNRALETSEKKERNWDETREKAKRALSSIAREAAVLLLATGLVVGGLSLAGQEPGLKRLDTNEWEDQVGGELKDLGINPGTANIFTADEDQDSNKNDEKDFGHITFYEDGYRYYMEDREGNGLFNYGERTDTKGNVVKHENKDGGLSIEGMIRMLQKNIPIS